MLGFIPNRIFENVSPLKSCFFESEVRVVHLLRYVLKVAFKTAAIIEDMSNLMKTDGVSETRGLFKVLLIA